MERGHWSQQDWLVSVFCDSALPVGQDGLLLDSTDEHSQCQEPHGPESNLGVVLGSK